VLHVVQGYDVMMSRFRGAAAEISVPLERPDAAAVLSLFTHSSIR
jgi:hypothetical protein